MLGAEHLRLVSHYPSLLDTALQELEEGAARLPADPATQSNLALALLVKGSLDTGLKHALKAVQLNPSQSKSRYVLGQLLVELGHYDEAIHHLRVAAREVEIARDVLQSLQNHLIR